MVRWVRFTFIGWSQLFSLQVAYKQALVVRVYLSEVRVYAFIVQVYLLNDRLSGFIAVGQILKVEGDRVLVRLISPL